MIRPYRGVAPRIAASAYIDPSAQIIGDVVIGDRSSVWCLTTIRGDVHSITIGQDTNIQDNSCLHVQRDTWPLVIGDRVSIGHSVNLHGCVIEDDVLIGIGAIVLNGARIGSGSIVAAGALVTERTQVPPRSVLMGSPAKIKRESTPEDLDFIRRTAQNYVHYRTDYMESAQ